MIQRGDDTAHNIPTLNLTNTYSVNIYTFLLLIPSAHQIIFSTTTSVIDSLEPVPIRCFNAFGSHTTFIYCYFFYVFNVSIAYDVHSDVICTLYM